MSAVTSLNAREIPDSRGKPTVEVELVLGGTKAVASVPAGASVGTHEAKLLPTTQAVAAINSEVAAALAGKEFTQQTLDSFLCALDGTPNKARLGANAILAVSIAFARASAQASSVPLYQYLAALAGTTPALPCPMFNLINGGKHAHNNLDIQEFLAVPVGVEGTRERMRAGEVMVAQLKTLLGQHGDTPMGDEGGFAPQLQSDEAALDLLVQAREAAGYLPPQVRLSIDAAASSSTQKHDTAWWAALVERYDLLSVEDPCGEDDAAGFAALQSSTRALVVGDDLTVTQAPRIVQAAQAGAIKAVILKPNQVGTVSEAVDAATAARAAGLTLIASHRSGETLDTFIADFAVGLACDYLKAGAPTRPERIAKYNRLMEIAQTLES